MIIVNICSDSQNSVEIYVCVTSDRVYRGFTIFRIVLIKETTKYGNSGFVTKITPFEKSRNCTLIEFMNAKIVRNTNMI